MGNPYKRCPRRLSSRHPFEDSGARSALIEASAAGLVRANMKKLRGECHCGARMPLSRLRDHLRACGPNAHLYPPRRKFGHEFRQPSFVGGQPAPSIDLAAEEEAALQAAILASLEG